jgi:nitrate reductase gamma subunit
MNDLILHIIPTKLVVFDLIQGPLVWLSFIIFIIGIIAQTYRYTKMTKINEFTPQIPEKEIPKLKTKSKLERFFYKLAFVKLSAVGFNPLLVTISLVFHFCLLVTPVFLLAHNVLLESVLGFGLFSFSPQTSHILTGIILACGFFFILRRIILRRVRAITTFNDYLLLALALAPFLTGFMAHQNIYDYNIMVLLHILSCELLLIMIPFSKFFHMVFFFIGRFMIVNEHSLGTPNRSWQF